LIQGITEWPQVNTNFGRADTGYEIDAPAKKKKTNKQNKNFGRVDAGYDKEALSW
jgi:hypothetical protein